MGTSSDRTSCIGCRYLYREKWATTHVVDRCSLTGSIVGFECTFGCVEYGGCEYYLPYPVWPKGAVP